MTRNCLLPKPSVMFLKRVSKASFSGVPMGMTYTVERDRDLRESSTWGGD